MSNHVYMSLHKVESVNLDGSPRYVDFGPWYEIVAYDDGAHCSEYIGNLSNPKVLSEVGDAFTPGGAIRWIREHEDEYDGLADWALEHGMYIMDDWYDPEELMRSFDEPAEEDN